MVSKLREQLLLELLNYQSDFPEELVFRDRLLDLLQKEDCFSRSLLTGHITASAWVLDDKRSSIILLHHAKLNRWLQPGGHADGEEDVRQVAIKEATEETGISGLKFLKNEIFDLDIHTIPERKGVPEHGHYDIRFLFIAPKGAEPAVNHESNQIEWVTFENLKANVSVESSLLRMLDKSKKFVSE
jgi:8-oxo-dGTP pyrophosphatase MutT (NUDIX family)